jgi:hypothetical protein
MPRQTVLNPFAVLGLLSLFGGRRKKWPVVLLKLRQPRIGLRRGKAGRQKFIVSD